MEGYPPNNMVGFGPDANCTLSTCPLSMSVYKYRPSLPVNALFIALFAVAMTIHIVLGIRWKTWSFMAFMILGCLSEIVGYAARLILYNNPFKFLGFILQICFITMGPVYYTAAIYVTLSKTIYHLAPELSRFNPKLFYWIFIPLDLVCLGLQAAGGSLSTQSNGSSSTGIDITMAGLILQVIVIGAFIGAFADYMARYMRDARAQKLSMRLRLFLSFLALAIVLILGRCIYRAYELSQGYRDSALIQNEVLFIVLEGVLIIISVFALCIGHPGMLLGRPKKIRSSLS
ncbi:hypothetical protein E4U41_006651 [Claviceps citrina]|nr:hypothetical protein E4U41_006651 [Claviceps citrina]